MSQGWGDVGRDASYVWSACIARLCGDGGGDGREGIGTVEVMADREGREVVGIVRVLEEGRDQGTRVVQSRVAEAAGLGLVGVEGEDLVALEEGRISVVGGRQVNYLAKGVVRICPQRVVWRRIDALGGLAADIAVDGQVEIVTRGRGVEVGVDKERDELQMQGIRVADVLVQAVVEIDEDSRDVRRQGGEAAEGQRRRKRPGAHLAVAVRTWSLLGLVHEHV